MKPRDRALLDLIFGPKTKLPPEAPTFFPFPIPLSDALAELEENTRLRIEELRRKGVIR